MVTKYIPSQGQPTDILTKGLSKVQHEYLSSKLDIMDISHPLSDGQADRTI